jgi:hypothetical protein
MSWRMSLEIARKPNSSPFDEEMRRGVTDGREAHIADLMLFDRSSLAEAQSLLETNRIFFDRYPERGGETHRIMLSELAEAQSGGETHRILLSERTRAVECFRRRLPRVLEALSWHPVAVDTLPRFGKFFERIDWPYVMLETDEYRMNFLNPQWFMTSEEFDRMLEFSVSAIDDHAMAAPGNPFGGEGRYSPAWEKLLEFCFFPPELIYAGDERALEAWPCGSPAFASRSSALLKTYLLRSPMLSKGPYGELMMMTTRIGATSA